jgi:hypothetical protein
MAVRTKSRDRNRWRKVYPRFRKEPSPTLVTSGKVVLDAAIVEFNNQDSKVVTFKNYYSSGTPSVTVSPMGDISDVNVFISSIVMSGVPSSGGRQISITIESSAAITGLIHIQVMEA